jgi:ankyrin repeat protein
MHLVNQLLIMFMIVSFNLMRAMDCPLKDNLKEIILSNDETRLQAALDNGIQIDARESDGITPLCRATQEGLIKMVEILLKQKARVNFPDGDGYTPLHCAALKGHTAIVRMLLDHQADSNVRIKGDQKYGETPLHLACQWKRFLKW